MPTNTKQQLCIKPTGCCIIGQQTNVDWNALVPLVSNGNKHRCTYVHLKIFILVDVVTLLYMDEVMEQVI